MENYFFMTVLQVLNSFFYLAIYPYLIKTLGSESYGLYVFAYSISMYFVSIVGFGFDMPGVNAISLNANVPASKSNTLSSIFTAKIYLEIVAAIFYCILIFSVPALRKEWLLYFICFGNTFTNILFPIWYFQGIQKMRTVTLIQVGFKLISLPFIFIFIKSSNDLNLYALVILIANIGGSLTAFFIIRFVHSIEIKWVDRSKLKVWYKDATPFFGTIAAGTIKSQSIVVIIGILFTRSDVAIYDLANKIISIPSTLVTSINGALFPKLIANLTSKKIIKVITYEFVIGFITIIALVIFGRNLVLMLGGKDMLMAYPMVVILSATIVAWLVVGAYISFVFIPRKLYHYAAKNQIVALISFFVYFFIGIFFVKSVFLLTVALSLSALTELAYCWLVVRKRGLLS